jgi:hypothetical protein
VVLVDQEQMDKVLMAVCGTMTPRLAHGELVVVAVHRHRRLERLKLLVVPVVLDQASLLLDRQSHMLVAAAVLLGLALEPPGVLAVAALEPTLGYRAQQTLAAVVALLEQTELALQAAQAS